ncbi:MAG TPA: hypothetical protein VFU05_02785 [Cyclobacteriaceae bacterium]|nr:hypothetical protein [Cyclobacteriaceae bacterium]
MVTIYPKSMEFKVHSLVANKNIGDNKNGAMKQGDMKDCLIMEYSDKRYAVFTRSWDDFFYIVIPNLQELHETFNEQLQIN